MPPEGAAADWLRPEGLTGAGALMTTRQGGVSAVPFDGMNIRDGIGDAPACVAENRRRLAVALAAEAGVPVQPVWLNQVHGTRVVRLTRADAGPAGWHDADASVTTAFGIACTAQVADCLPVLFAAPGGVGAAHAGWRGLAGGVLEATVAALSEAAGCTTADIRAWLGPCIGPRHFEVGADVWRAFGAGLPGSASAAAFMPRAPRSGADTVGEDKWLADLPQLARLRLAACGVGVVSGGAWCTVEDDSRFFSYRRDRLTGRMVAAVWRVR